MMPSDLRPIWLLQFDANSELSLRLSQLRQGQVEREGEWPVERYSQQLQAGDTLLFWATGLGLIAVGQLLSAAYLAEAEDPMSWHIGFEITGLLPEPLPRKALKALPTWSQEPFFKRPQGRVFKVSSEAWAELQAHLPELFQPQGLPAPQKMLDKWAEKIRQQGLLLPKQTLYRYHLALTSASLVILSGPSGVGKSWLAQAYAQVSGAESCLLAVSPHWNQPEDWLGYFNPLEKCYVDSPASLFLKRAAHEWNAARRDNRPSQAYHLILDEMNLARIEHYFAPLLSGLEIMRRQGAAPLWLGGDAPISLTPNLHVVGTINLDESTHLLADKIYDRAQVLSLEATQEDICSLLDGLPYRAVLRETLTCLSPVIPLSFRTCKDILSYIESATQLGLTWQTALDQQILQKLLARLRSSDPTLLNRLNQLADLLPETDFPLTRKRLSQLIGQWQREGFVFGH